MCEVSLTTAFKLMMCVCISLLPSEGQHLPGQRSRAIGCIGDLQQRFAQRIVGRDLAQHQFGGQLDDHQNVVEVVGHASCQPADRLQLLHLPDLLLQRALLGHVLDIAFEVLSAVWVADEGTGETHRHGAAIAPPEARLQAFEDGTPADDLSDRSRSLGSAQTCFESFSCNASSRV